MTAASQPETDSALIERMIAGEESALSTLYDRYSAALLGMLVRILGDGQAAEEVLQDVFLHLWRNAGRFDSGRGSLSGWLLVMARNRGISRLRVRSGREVLEEEDGDYANYFVSAENQEEEAARMQTRGIVKAALDRLPAEQRKAIELAYFEGMSQSEIAERTGIPLGTVKTRVRAAMQTLKQVLARG